MLHRGNLRRVVGASTIALLIAALMAFYVADIADAGPTRCQQHRLDARERAAVVTGRGERVLVIGDSWSVGLGLSIVKAVADHHHGHLELTPLAGGGLSVTLSLPNITLR